MLWTIPNWLDALIHADMRPLAPVSEWNPLLFRVEHDHVYLACVVLGAIAAESDTPARRYVHSPPARRKTCP